MEEFVVKKEESNKRIDAYLAANTNSSRVTIQRLIEEGKITVNNKDIKASYKVQEGDKIIKEDEEIKEISLKAQEIPLEILYEDKIL